MKTELAVELKCEACVKAVRGALEDEKVFLFLREEREESGEREDEFKG